MSGSALYTTVDQDRSSREKHETSFYMMNNFLYSRLDSNYPTNIDVYDEDVNVYIANLLTSISKPEYHAIVGRYVVPYDISLNQRVEKAASSWERYLYYRTNADFLFLSISLFNNPKLKRPNSAPYMKLSRDCYIGRAEVYYKLALSHLCKSCRGRPAIADILEKLSGNLRNYIHILSYMKAEYLNLHKRMSDGEIFHFQKSVIDIDREKILKELYDYFLDYYSEYKKRKTPYLRNRIETITRKIRALNPDFKFMID